MKKASLISVGNELLDGQTVDTNAAFLGTELFCLGIPVLSRFTVGDEIQAIVRMLGLACQEADVVVVTGGLGPTADDLTRQALAAFLGVELELRQDLLGQIQAFFDRRGRAMPKANSIQACIPAGAQALANDVGTAPGVLVQRGGKVIALLPGVPFEMRRMFGQAVVPVLREACLGQVVAVRRLRCFGEGESAIAERIAPDMDRGRNPLVNCTVDHGVVTLHVVAAGEEAGAAEVLADQEVGRLKARLGPLVFGTGDQTLAQVLTDQLAARHKTLCVAESCTGGLTAKMLTDVPGSSQVFLCGWVAYSNQAKIRDLGVPTDCLGTYGAVSEQVACAMAQGARRRAQADYAIGITGRAGPTGGHAAKPVGMVFISIDADAGTRTERFLFPGDRPSVRLRTAQSALNLVRISVGL